YKMSVTNSLLVNTYMYGKRPLDGDDVSGALINGIDSIANWPDSSMLRVDFGEQDRRILLANNSYGIEPWLLDWMENSPQSRFLRQQRRDDEIPEPVPMLNNGALEFLESEEFPYMNAANLYDGVVPRFVLAPTNADSLKPYLNCKWDTNCDGNWAWQPDDGWNQLWPMEEDLSYSNDTLITAAMGNFPLGDLYRWWPEQYAQWEAQKEDEYSRIYTWLETGIDPDAVSVRPAAGVPQEYTLGQNYPNPFNPSTEIKYSVPVQGHVSLKVFNSLGQEAATIFEGIQPAGNYVATFNAAGLSSGVYFYRLEAGDFQMTKKLMLMK
ncbi:MAG: T9SS type A sorting domain-containing protein, partial [Ignavibacteriaceae bacterium]